MLLNKINILFISFVTLMKLTVQQQSPLSPCPKVFYYETDGIQWYGIIEVSSPKIGSVMRLDLKMSIKTKLPTKYVGRIELLGERSEILQKLLSGLPIKYKVHFPLLTIIPKTTSIVFNGRRLCTGPPASGQYVTAITLQHVLHTDNTASGGSVSGNRTRSRNRNKNAGSDNPTYTQYSGSDSNVRVRPTSDSQIFVADTVNPETFATELSNRPLPRPTSKSNMRQRPSFPCGVSRKTSNALIIGGDVTSRGDWPWIVALYTKKVNGLDFICAGSLISHKHVVTAAHCVYQKNNRLTKVEELVLKLGVYNLQDWGDTNVKTVDVTDIKMHPSFDGGLVLVADIAILEIDYINFSNHIIPVCIWNENNDLYRVVGLKGTVIGWGRDENGLLATPEPRQVNIPIVSTETCRASKPEFFYLTSNTTLCAGDKNGIGPCNGDSGGGLYMYRNSKWTLRGIVSNSLKDPNAFNACDLHEYVVFTDAAKYSSWIKHIVRNSK